MTNRRQLYTRPAGGLALASTLMLWACGNPSTDAPANVSGATVPSTSTTTPITQAKRVDERVPLPDWLPTDIYLPEDFEATQVLPMPNGLHLLRGISQTSPEDLIHLYIQSLSTAGYEVVDRPGQQAKGVVQFRGKTLSDSIIRIRDDSDRRELQISLKFRSSPDQN